MDSSYLEWCNQLYRETKALNFLTADLWSRGLEVYVGDRDGSGRQHGDDHHQHIRARRWRVTSKVKENPQTVSVKHSHR